MKKVAATIEARMGSSRLPGKVLLPAAGITMLEFLVSRLRGAESIEEIVIATTTDPADDPIAEAARRCGVAAYRGSVDDVMARVIGAADSVGADTVVEITGDCPLIDPGIVEQAIRIFKHNRAEYVSNAEVRSFPDGMDVQVFALDTLKRSASLTNRPLDREHVTLHIRKNPQLFPPIHFVAPPELHWPDLGLTLDERADYELLKRLIEHFHPAPFSCLDIVRHLRAHPELIELNRAVQRKGDA